MQKTSEQTKETPAFGIALILATISFIVLFNHLPFSSNYGFWNLAGIFVACCMLGGSVFAIAAALVNGLFKVIIEILVVLLILFNVVFVSLCWSFFDAIVFELSMVGEPKFLPILILATALFLIDLFAIIILLPFSRVANSKVLDY